LNRFGLAAASAATALVIASGASAQAPVKERVFGNPPVLGQPSTATGAASLLRLPAPGPRASHERSYNLDIRYVESKLFDPATGLAQKVRLRGYVGTDTDPERPYIAPTIEVAPGDTVRVTLNNKLPVDATCTDSTQSPDVPHCFNGTNLHSHGLWVSPTGNSDNVLLKLLPGNSFQYEYNIPSDHPSGTFWYHPHLHGSTALQVAGGMAGALIVRGERKPTPVANGDLDTLLVDHTGASIPEKLLVFQQIQYACEGSDHQLKTLSSGKIDWTCLPGETGVIESYKQFGPGTWAASGRWTSINGQVLPHFFGPKSGLAERWRLVHAGVRETITVQFRKLKPNIGSIDALRLQAKDSERFVQESCVGEPVPYQIVSSDGLTMAKAQEVTATTLQPGYRNDLLVVFPEAGEYCVTEVATPASGNVSEAASGREILGFVTVGSGPTVSGADALRKALTEQLVATAERVYPDPLVKAKVVADLKDGLKLTSFVPRPTIKDDEVNGY
jgi:FtsP/CotA-like multicopper oxidase with cupredoxin domain